VASQEPASWCRWQALPADPAPQSGFITSAELSALVIVFLVVTLLRAGEKALTPS